MSARGKQAGLTLVELLVAIGIFALVSIMAYGGLIQILNSRDRLEAEREFWRTFTFAFRRLEEDLGQVREREVRDVDGMVRLAWFLGQPVDPRALARPSLEFTRGGVPVLGPAARSDLQRVGYRLSEGKLIRLTWPNLDRAPQDQPGELVLLEGVDDFVLRFYGPKGEWTDLWPPLDPSGVQSKVPPPRGVEVTIRLRERGEFTRTFLVGPPSQPTKPAT